MRKFLLLFLFVASFYEAAADTVTLKTGDKLNGKITSETDSQVTMRVQVSATISDERTINKDEIASIEKEQPDELAFQDLRNLKPDPQMSYSADTYDRILSMLRNFNTKFPQSAHNVDVLHAMEEFEAEKTHVAAGEVKYLGRWITKDMAEKRKIQIQAQNYLGTMRQQASAGDFIGALNAFDLFEKSYAMTRFYPDAVELAKLVLQRFQAQLANMARTQAYEMQQFQQGLALSSAQQKTQLIAAAQREQAGFDAVIASAQKGSKWVPLIPRSAKSIQVLQAATATELQRLKGVQVQPMRDSIALVDKAREAIEAKDYATADTLLKQATSKWSQNEAAKFWSNELAAAKAAASPSATPSAAPSAKPVVKHVATPEPSATPEAVSGSRPFYMTLPGALTIVGILLVVLGAGALFNRMQAKKQIDE